MSQQWQDRDPGDVHRPSRRPAHKDIQISARVNGDTNELIDQLATMQDISHAEVIRRGVHLLAAQCGLRTHADVRP